jgi:hypothetical protein
VWQRSIALPEVAKAQTAARSVFSEIQTFRRKRIGLVAGPHSSSVESDRNCRDGAQQCCTPTNSLAVSEAEEFVRGGYQTQGEDGYGDFAYRAYSEGAEALFAHFAEVGTQAYAGEG